MKFPLAIWQSNVVGNYIIVEKMLLVIGIATGPYAIECCCFLPLQSAILPQTLKNWGISISDYFVDVVVSL